MQALFVLLLYFLLSPSFIFWTDTLVFSRYYMLTRAMCVIGSSRMRLTFVSSELPCLYCFVCFVVEFQINCFSSRPRRQIAITSSSPALSE
jgi:hypothetical protein